MSHSPFALPDSLSFKNTPALIGPDEQRFAEIAAALDDQLLDTARRLAEASRGGGSNNQERLDRDFAVRRLGARLRMLQRFGVDLCLGRMTPADGSEPVWIGRLGLADADGKRLLIDWRTPAAEPFFGATHLDPMGLASRRRYRWTSGRITDYWDEGFTPDALTDAAALDDQSAFIASLGTSRSARMRDVLGTIQADQDAIIRDESHGALVVDGGPGTGKTVVALHRAAYLLYADPRLDERRGGVLFIGPHQPYLAYVEDVLPSLGEEGVRIGTLDDLVPESADAVSEADPRVRALKQSLPLVGAVEDAVRFFEQVPAQDTVIETEWADMRITPADWERAMQAVEYGEVHNEARGAVWEEVLRILVNRYGEDAANARYLRRALERDDELATAFDAVWPILEAGDVLARLFSDPVALAAAAPSLSADEVALLQREDPRAWTDADLPLLDAARLRVGDPGRFAAQRERDAAEAVERRYRAEIVEYLVDADDDGEGAIMMLRGEDSAALREKLVDWDALPGLARDEVSRQFAHIVVDEAQELTDAQWAMLLRRDPSRSFTVVGDRAQARAGFTESWRERLERVGIRDVRERGLTVNYRTPAEVMAAAAPVIRAVLPDANVPTSVRESGIPVRHGSVSERDDVLRAWLDTHPQGLAAVIADDSFGSSAFASHERVRFLTPVTAKGLEFDLVVIMRPDAFGDGVTGAVDLYVAMTRPTQELVLLS